MQVQIERLSGWGNYPVRNCKVLYPFAINNFEFFKGSIPRGMGRSYADQSLSDFVIKSGYLNRFLDFDEENGILWVESGATFEDILRYFLPRGWFPYITPGTKFVSIGGAIASDVHGKNHHKEGSISNYVLGFNLIIPSGERVYCTGDENAELFYITLGGMGLTGFILDAKIKLRRVETSYILYRSVRVKDLDHMLATFEENDPKYTYSVAWIDCLSRGKNFGRGVVMFGEHAKLSDLPKDLKSNPLMFLGKTKINVPFYLPDFVLSDWTVKAFNQFYYLTHPDCWGVVDYERFFYPLDSVLNWNRAYGKRGFVQFQFVVPDDAGLKEIFSDIVGFGGNSFLAVLKKMGKQDGYLAFGMEGWTLALDFPIRGGLFEFLKALTDKVIKFGGRVYLTKDAVLTKERFFDMYPNAKRWMEIRAKYDPQGLIYSDFSKRIGLTP
ncbi:MAG: FAD-binding oxidoreductase [candidate division WOR-3 bacterium]